MTKQIFASILILGLVGMIVGLVAQGATSSDVTATVTPGTIGVSVLPTSFDYGYVPVNTSDTGPTITATVETVNTDLEIKGYDTTTTGTSWVLDSVNTTLDHYVHKAGLGDPDTAPISYTITLSTSYATLATGISPSGSQDFGLEITTPASVTSATAQQSAKVTVLASWGG